MTDNITETPPATEIKEEPSVKPNVLSTISSKIPEKFKSKFKAFAANKKVFVPLVAAFGLIFLVLIIGLLFGRKGEQRAPQARVTPTPQGTVAPPVVAGDQLTQIQFDLNRIKDQILSLDVRQSRLQPPEINYEIEF
jgi:hypothetical protein